MLLDGRLHFIDADAATKKHLAGVLLRRVAQQLAEPRA